MSALAPFQIPGTGYRTAEALVADQIERTFGTAASHRPALPWRQWLRRHFANYTKAPFAERHVRFWEWVTGLTPGKRPRPRVEVWPRGGAKSTTIELSLAYLGSAPSPVRHYALYVSETQAQADKHVAAVAAMLESLGVGRAMNEYGVAKGWRRQEIRTSTGFNITAFGLDSGMRGVKLDEYRPDLIIMDDIDGRHDTPATTQKKIDVITESILPAGSADVAVVVVQNAIHADSIVSQLADGRADFLYDREPATVEPAVRDLTYEQTIQPDGTPYYRITGGEPTWAGQDLETCERQLNLWGPNAFEREAQHNVEVTEGGLWEMDRDIEPFRVTEVPDLDRIVVGVDPNAGGADEAGIIVAGISWRIGDELLLKPHGFVLADRTVSGGSKVWAEEAVTAYHAYRADALVAEANNGGDMVAVTIETVENAPRVELVHASRGKITRAEPVQKLYADGRVHHVGRFRQLEREQCTWRPGQPSPNRMDALVWAITDLLLEGEADLGHLQRYMRRQLGRPTT